MEQVQTNPRRFILKLGSSSPQSVVGAEKWQVYTGTFMPREPLILQNIQKLTPGQETSEHQVVGCQKSNLGKCMLILFLYLVSPWIAVRNKTLGYTAFLMSCC